MNDKNKKEEMALQTRCVHCGKEQYAMAVLDVSKGEHPCVWCGEYSHKMTIDEYYDELEKVKQ